MLLCDCQKFEGVLIIVQCQLIFWNSIDYFCWKIWKWYRIKSNLFNNCLIFGNFISNLIKHKIEEEIKELTRLFWVVVGSIWNVKKSVLNLWSFKNEVRLSLFNFKLIFNPSLYWVLTFQSLNIESIQKSKSRVVDCGRRVNRHWCSSIAPSWSGKIV